MRSKIKWDKVCVVIGYVDERGKYCCEVHETNPANGKVIEQVDWNHDVTMCVCPESGFMIVANSMEKIVAYVEHEVREMVRSGYCGSTNWVKMLLTMPYDPSEESCCISYYDFLDLPADCSVRADLLKHN